MARTARKKRAAWEPGDPPGYEGNVLIDSPVRLTATRFVSKPLRCRPGTFEWRYARKADALYEAGTHYALLWERAGTASASSPDLEAVGGGAWKGLPNGRAVAMDDLKHAFRELGKAATSRLTAYCVEGSTTSDIADQYGIPERDMRAVLHQDLVACAAHFRFGERRSKSA